MLPVRKLGTLTVSAIGLGCWEFTGKAYGAADETESITVIRRAVELGVNFFDTAEAYGPFTNEELLGRVLRDYRRDEIVIATKFGFRYQNGMLSGTDSRPEHIPVAVEGSLQRLQIDHIDLLYQHRVDFDVPIEDTVGAMSRLVEQGKVRHLGLSEAGEKTIRRAHRAHPIAAVQSEYSLFERNLEDAIMPALRELGIGLVPFAPLGRGFLTGAVKRAEDYPPEDWRHTDPRFQGANFDANLAILRAVQDLAAAKNVTTTQIALAWLLQKGLDIVPIPGTRSRQHLEENIASISVLLSPEEIARLEAVFSLGAIAGPRYNEARMKLVVR